MVFLDCDIISLICILYFITVMERHQATYVNLHVCNVVVDSIFLSSRCVFKVLFIVSKSYKFCNLIKSS